MKMYLLNMASNSARLTKAWDFQSRAVSSNPPLSVVFAKWRNCGFKFQLQDCRYINRPLTLKVRRYVPLALEGNVMLSISFLFMFV